MNMTINWPFFTVKFLKSDNNNRILITLTGLFYWYFNRSDLGLGQSDHINRMITLTVITLSGFYCNKIFCILNYEPN
jgi:hypothetical protein